MPKTKPTNETQSGYPYSGQTNSTFTNVTSGQSSGSFTTETGVTINVSPGVATLNTLKKVNEVQRIVQRNSSIYTKDLVQSLIEKIRMLQKQKKFLQTKLREATNESKNIDS
tara:strand:- start:282 stop:617 length:336 start_codon:yes stop_codon:yes gene_type:complete